MSKEAARHWAGRLLLSGWLFSVAACAKPEEPKWEKDLTDGNYIRLPEGATAEQPKMQNQAGDFTLPPPPAQTLDAPPAQTLDVAPPPAVSLPPVKETEPSEKPKLNAPVPVLPGEEESKPE